MTKRSLGNFVKIVSGIIKGASIVGNIISGARTVGGMIIDDVNTIINYKKAVRVRDHLFHVSKAILTDIKGNRKNLYWFNKDLDRIYEYTGILRNTTADKLTTIYQSTVNLRTNMRYMSSVLKFYMSHLEMQMHEYQDLTQTIDHFLNGLSVVNTGQLSPALISPDVLYHLITQVVTDIIRRNLDLIPVFTTLQNYYQQAMTSFTNTEKIVQIPILFKNRLQKPMNLYKMITVPVPYEKDTYEEKHNTYTQLKLKEDHIAVTDDAYITLYGHQLQGCYKQGPTYYCESLHFTSHTSEHNCASAIYFQAPSEQVIEKCRFVYYDNRTPELKILETQTVILLSNLPRPWQLICRSQTEHPVPMASAPYAFIKREDLCPCGIIAQHYFLHENMIRCPYPNNEVTLYYVHNKILLDFHVRGEDKEDVIEAKLLLEPPETCIMDLKVMQGKFPKVLVRQS